MKRQTLDADSTLVSSTVTDIGDMSFALDTSLFWMETLASPDTTIAVIAVTSGLISFHLTQCHRTDFNVKRKYQNVSEVIFYSPDNPIMYQVREYTRSEFDRLGQGPMSIQL